MLMQVSTVVAPAAKLKFCRYLNVEKNAIFILFHCFAFGIQRRVKNERKVFLKKVAAICFFVLPKHSTIFNRNNITHGSYVHERGFNITSPSYY